MPDAAPGATWSTCCTPATRCLPATPIAEAIASVQALAAARAPQLPRDNFRVEPIEAMAWPDAFRRRRDQQRRPALRRATTAVRRDGATDVGRPDARRPAVLSAGLHDRAWSARVRPIAGRRHLLPDGSERYLVDEPMLLALTARLGGRLLDPLKTTVVQDQRSMTTWVVRKERVAGASGMTGCDRPAADRRSRDRTWRPASPWSCRCRGAG